VREPKNWPQPNWPFFACCGSVRGESTLREAITAIGRGKAYPLVLKLMLIPTAFPPAYSQEHTQRRFVRDLLDRLVDGSRSKLRTQPFRCRRRLLAEVSSN
jgi:hypothetical protein